MILITGATGKAGSEVVRAVRERGGRVRAFVRDPEKAHEMFGHGVELAIGDFADAGSVRAALDGVDEVFSPAPTTRAGSSGRRVRSGRRLRRECAGS
jgi:uncharacterized protein YbjT (DUF2867 family)